MSIRALSTISDASELNLSKTVLRAMERKPMDVKTLIMLVRDGRHLSLQAVGTKREEEVRDTVADAGFLLRESVEAQGVRRLLMAVFDRTSLSEDEYEAQVPFSDQQCSAFAEILAGFSDLERWVLERCYGLAGIAPWALSDIARMIGCEYSRVLKIRRECLIKLRGFPLRGQLIEIFSNFPIIPAEDINRKKCHSEATRTPIDDLVLSNCARRCLTEAGVLTAEQLRSLTPAEVANLPGIGDTYFAEISDAINSLDPAPQPNSLRSPIRKLGLSNRAVNCLKRAGIVYIDQFKSQTSTSINDIRGMGRKTQAEVIGALSRLDP